MGLPSKREDTRMEFKKEQLNIATNVIGFLIKTEPAQPMKISHLDAATLALNVADELLRAWQLRGPPTFDLNPPPPFQEKLRGMRQAVIVRDPPDADVPDLGDLSTLLAARRAARATIETPAPAPPPRPGRRPGPPGNNPLH